MIQAPYRKKGRLAVTDSAVNVAIVASATIVGAMSYAGIMDADDDDGESENALPQLPLV
jgi:hypothetical protein